MKIEKLGWDSDFFGFNIVGLELKQVDSYNPILLNNYLIENSTRLVQCCLDISDTKNINCMIRDGFEFVDLKMNFIASINGTKSTINTIRRAVKEDIKNLRNVAGAVFTKDSRYNHKNIDEKKVKRLYQLWAEKAVLGTFDDYCLVTERDEKAKGFITIREISKKRVVIGLIGVSEDSHGMGIGSELIKGCLETAWREHYTEIEVSTEGRNLGAQNFYIKNGFKIKEIKVWYYKWIN